MATSLFENQGIDIDKLPLRSPSELPTVAQTKALSPDVDHHRLIQMERSQPWNAVDRSATVLTKLGFLLTEMSMKAREPGVVGSYDNAVQCLPEDAASCLTEYHDLGEELSKALRGEGEILLSEFLGRIATLRDNTIDILLYVAGSQNLSD